MDDALKKLGYDTRLRKIDSIAQRPRGYISALSDSINREEGPFAPPTLVSKGTIETTGGGLVKLFDTTGGTLIFTYDPDTGAITLNGALVNISILSAGTIRSTTFIGTSTNSALITGGTYNNGIFGTPAVTGGTYNTATLGSPTVVGGIYTSGTFNDGVLGTPSVTGGTVNQGKLLASNITTGTITDKLAVTVGANASIGKGTLTTGIATISTTAVTATSNIFLTPIASGLNLGIFAVGTINAGTNFVVTSSNALDSDSFNWWLVN